MLTDKEETGSDGNTGLNSEYMRYFIADLAQAEGEEPRHVLSKSTWHFPPTSPRHMIRIMLPLTRRRTPPTSTAVWA